MARVFESELLVAIFWGFLVKRQLIQQLSTSILVTVKDSSKDRE